MILTLVNNEGHFEVWASLQEPDALRDLARMPESFIVAQGNTARAAIENAKLEIAGALGRLVDNNPLLA